MSGIRLIAGLGNPGPQYRFTRHNAGALFLESLCDEYHGELKPDNKLFGLAGRISVAGADIRLLIPTTYMNHSGRSLAAIVNYFKIPADGILVAYDEIDLPVGTTKLKHGGGHGGHNGLRDVIAALGTGDFLRLRIGIGHPGEARKVHDYVLSEPSRHDAGIIQHDIDRAIAITPLLAEGQFEKAMTTLHTKEN